MFLRIFYAISLLFFACSDETPTVTYGGEDYETVAIGKQIWLKRNLNYVTANSRCYEDNNENCEKYGRLYNWATAMALPDNCNRASCASQIKIRHQGICPDGWHIPASADWDKLFRYVDGTNGTDSPYKSETAGKYLKAENYWNDSGNGEDAYGFSALPGGAGYPTDSSFYNVGNSGYWWSSSEINSTNAFRRGMHYNSDNIGFYSYGKTLMLSVRCVRD